MGDTNHKPRATRIYLTRAWSKLGTFLCSGPRTQILPDWAPPTRYLEQNRLYFKALLTIPGGVPPAEEKLGIHPPRFPSPTRRHL